MNDVMLSDGAIRKALEAGRIRISPPPADADLRSFGVRLRLGADLLIPAYSPQAVDLADPGGELFEPHVMDGSGYLIEPHDFVLACTLERVGTDRTLGCSLDGRSSIARQGLFVHCGSSIVDSIHGPPRVVVLELYNCSGRSLRIRPELPIAMIAFFNLDGVILQEESPQYADQQMLLPPRQSATP